MKPRDVAHLWKKVSNTYGVKVGPPSRMVGKQKALKQEEKDNGQ